MIQNEDIDEGLFENGLNQPKKFIEAYNPDTSPIAKKIDFNTYV